MATRPHHTAQAPDPAQVLTQAVTNAASLMGLNKSTLAKIVGISAATAGRMVKGNYLLNPGNKEWDLATLLVRLYRSLDAIMAGDEASLRSWLLTDNRALNARPIDLLSNTAGLVHTVDYVDAYRARV